MAVVARWKRWTIRAGVWMYWLVFICATMFAIAVIFAWGMMWSIPNMAEESKTDSFHIALRGLEWGTDHPADPFYLLGANPSLKKGIIEIVEQRDSGIDGSITATEYRLERLGPYEIRHLVKSSGGREFSFLSTTPHLIVPPDELHRAMQSVQETYSVDEKLSPELAGWGGGLLYLAWARVNSHSDIKPSLIPGPVDGTPEEQAWLIWQALSAGQPTAEADLPRLVELLESAFPNESDRDDAMNWAETLYRRLKESHQKFRELSSTMLNTDPEKVQVALPPDDPITYVWLLYQHVGLNDASRKAVLERYRALFPADKLDRVRAYGATLRKQRIVNGESLPPGGEVVDLLCVIERYLGRDQYGEKCRVALTDSFPLKMLDMLSLGIRTGYPNDDVFFVAGGGDSLELFTSSEETQMTIFAIVLALWGLRCLVLKVIAEWVLGLRENALFQEYRSRRGHRDIIALLIAFGIVPLFAWVVAIFTIPEEVDLLVSTPANLLIGSYLSVILGGTMMVTLTRFVAVVMIRAGIDVNRVWWDEIVGLSIGSFMLWHFGNAPATIAMYVAFDLAPAIISHLSRKRS